MGPRAPADQGWPEQEDAFTGAARWLEIAVQCTGDPSFILLSPRQALTAAPYALGLKPGANVVGAAEGPVIRGENTATDGLAVGVHGRSASTSGQGVVGVATATSGSTHGVSGRSESPDGSGVFGTAFSGTGVSGMSEVGIGVKGWVGAVSGSTYGVYGESMSDNGIGVYGHATATYGATQGVHGVSDSTSSGIGVYGQTLSTSGYAGFFVGNVDVNGTLTKDAGAFRIDHPLDPANKYLHHSFVESPDMMNIYNGNVTLDANGQAWVEMPAWFEALNRDFRYHMNAPFDKIDISSYNI